jgi:hypothetical protein
MFYTKIKLHCKQRVEWTQEICTLKVVFLVIFSFKLKKIPKIWHGKSTLLCSSLYSFITIAKYNYERIIIPNQEN